MPAPLETVAYESRERHGLQMRYISVETPGIDADDARSLANIRVGTGVIDRVWEMKSDVYTVIAETKKALRGAADEKEAAPTELSSPREEDTKPKCRPSDFSDEVQIQMDGGNMNLYPSVLFFMLLAVFAGQRSLDTGLLLHSLLSKVTMKYGQHLRQPTSSFSNGRAFRKRSDGILLFHDNLDPNEVGQVGQKWHTHQKVRRRARASANC